MYIKHIHRKSKQALTSCTLICNLFDFNGLVYVILLPIHKSCFVMGLPHLFYNKAV